MPVHKTVYFASVAGLLGRGGGDLLLGLMDLTPPGQESGFCLEFLAVFCGWGV